MTPDLEKTQKDVAQFIKELEVEKEAAGKEEAEVARDAAEAES